MNHRHPWQQHIKSLSVLTGSALIGLNAWGQVAAPAQDATDAPAADAAPTAEGPGAYLRVAEKPGESFGLEVATRKFVPRDGVGPAVYLVGVAHIGDANLYRKLQQVLGTFDVVLYESVKPAGAATPGGTTDEERIESTRAALGFTARMVGLYEDTIDSYPATTDDLIVGLSTIDPRLAQWMELARVDAWGAPVQFTRFADGHAFTLTSHGADGQPGGEGANADIIVHSDMPSAAYVSSSDDGLQAQLADALDLAFQLDAIDYGQDAWYCSDMTEDQFSRALAEKGLDFTEIGGTLAGSSLPAKVVKGLLRVAKFLDAFAEGRVSDMFKVMMIEVLADESITDSAMNTQFGQGFGDVIIGARNQVVMDDLKKLLAEQPDVASVGIFYGAAHMPDFEERLEEQFGYVPQSQLWIPAITIDLDDTAMTEQDIQTMRQMIRSSMGGFGLGR